MKAVSFALGFLAIFLPISYALPAAENRVENTYSALSFPVIAGLFSWLVAFLLVRRTRASLATLNSTTTFPLYVLFTILPISVLLSGTVRFFLPVYLWVTAVLLLAVLFHLFVIGTDREYLTTYAAVVFGLGLVSAGMAFTLALVGSIQIGPLEFQQSLSPRLNGWYGSPNRLGSMMAVSLLCGTYLLSTPRRRLHRHMILIGIIVLVGCLLSTANRSGVGGLLLGGLTFAAVGVPPRRLIWKSVAQGWKLSLVLAVGIICAFIVVDLIGTDLLEIYRRRSGFDPQNDVRMALWSTAVTEMRSASIIEFTFGKGYRYFQDRHGVHPHNGYLRFAVEYGILFLITYLIAMAMVFRQALRRARPEAGFVCALLVYFLTRDLFTTDLFQVKIEMLSFSVALAVCVVKQRATTYSGMMTAEGGIGRVEPALMRRESGAPTR